MCPPTFNELLQCYQLTMASGSVDFQSVVPPYTISRPWLPYPSEADRLRVSTKAAACLWRGTVCRWVAVVGGEQDQQYQGSSLG